MTEQDITLENCCITYRHLDGSVTTFSYSGQERSAISVLMERYLLLPKAYIKKLLRPDVPQWGDGITQSA